MATTQATAQKPTTGIRPGRHGALLPLGFSPLLLRMHGSILRSEGLRGPVLFFSLYTYVLYLLQGVLSLGGAGGVVGLLSLVVGLLISFRSNSSSDRWHEGRRVFADLRGEIRNIVRGLKVEREEVFTILGMYPHAVKHHLRGETGTDHPSLQPLKSFKFFSRIDRTTSLPLSILSYLQYAAPELSGNVSTLSNLLNTAEKIKSTPIPLALAIHLQQVLFLYLLCVPLQIVPSLGLYAVPVEAVTAFVFLGVEGIARELSDPFGYEENDLPLELFCTEIEKDIKDEVERKKWLGPVY
ncbi:hypothetical protein BT69DRAFT_1283846 [Atractiella rhizophila]|nr:hypothetical protein BT69DRAFT_1283846 [Atractiella rhizophila]